jgi:hypothetical protein
MTDKFRACQVTGEPTCACDPYNEPVFQINEKETLRKLFSDHANYDNLYTVAFLHPSASPAEYNALADRMLGNAVDIGNYFGSTLNIGQENGARFTDLLQDHILSAGDVLKSLKANKSDVKQKIQALFNNGVAISQFLSSMSEALSYDEVLTEFQRHNQYVVDLGNVYWSKQYKKYISTYDSFITHMLKFSDLLYAGFM